MSETTIASPVSHPPGAESRFQILFDQAPVGMVLFDPASGSLLEANQRLATILGLSPAALAIFDWKCLGHPVDGVIDGDPPGPPSSGGLDDYQGQRRHLRPDGSVVWIRMTATWVETGPGAGPQILVMVEDITASIGKEESLPPSEEQGPSGFAVTGDSRRELDAQRCNNDVSSIAEEFIRASEIKFKHLFQFAPIPLALKDPDGRILLCNDQFVRTFGYSAEDIQTLSRWYELFYPDEAYRRQAVASWEKVLPQGVENDSLMGPFEFRMTRKDGAVRHVEIFAMTLDREELAAFMDVTDRKQAELALLESVERLNEAQRVAHIGSWEWDVKRNRVWWSEELYRLFELVPGRDLPPSREELWGKFVHPDDQSAALAAYTQALAERRGFKIHVRLLLPDGRIKHIERIGRAEYAPDGTVTMTRGTTQDITQNKVIENHLRISEERHRLLADNAGDVIWTFDFHRGLTYVSPSIEKLTGYRPEEYLRLKLEDTCHPDSCLILREAIASAYAQVQAGIPVTFQIWDFEELHKDGSSVWTEIKASGIYDNDGNFVELLGITRDISEHKRSENELRQARLVAEGANQAKSEFLAHMSHEIRTPLYSLLGLAQMIDREPLSANQRDMVRRIHDAGQTLLGIISDIQDLSRIEAGKIEIDNRPFDLGALLQQLDGLLGLKARAEGNAINLSLSGSACSSGGSPGSLRVSSVAGKDLRLGLVLTQRSSPWPVSVTSGVQGARPHEGREGEETRGRSGSA